jgi:hypothetical protein
MRLLALGEKEAGITSYVLPKPEEATGTVTHLRLSLTKRTNKERRYVR